MCGQPTAYNAYATLPYTNPLFMGFSRSQNVNSSSQRDNMCYFWKFGKWLICWISRVVGVAEKCLIWVDK